MRLATLSGGIGPKRQARSRRMRQRSRCWRSDATAKPCRSARSLQGRDDFVAPVADALVALASGDGGAYALASAEVLRSFVEREAFLEDTPVADTVLVLDALAAARGITRPQIESELLPRVRA